jgi:hypothetical protein
MDSTLIAAVIGGGFTIAAIILTPIAQQYIDGKKIFPISKSRAIALEGLWNGMVIQCLPDATVRTINVDLKLRTKGNSILGTALLTLDTLYYVDLKGSFRNDRFLKMDYENTNKYIVQFGSFVFQLNDESNSLIGRFVGYGQVSEKIVYGEARFTKNKTKLI